MKPLSIRRKIWLTIITVSVFTILFVVSVSYYLYQTLYIEKQTDILQKQGFALEEAFHQNSEEEFTDMLNLIEKSSDTSVIFSDDPMQLGSGAPFDALAEQNLITFTERQQLLKGETLIFTKYHTGLGQEIRAVVLPIFIQNRMEAVIFLYMPLTAIIEAFQPIRIFLLLGMVGAVFILVLIGTKMTNTIVQPIRELEKIAKEITQGNFSKKMTVKGEDEIASLSNSINIMSSNLYAEDKKRREFLGNVSHELRTPISYLKGYSEAMEEGYISSERYVETVKKETNRMSQLVHDLLDLAQLEGESYPINKEPVILAEILKEVIDRFQLELKEKNMQVVFDLDEDVVVNGDQERLDQVIVNLVSNAVKYSQANHELKLSVFTDGETGVLRVEDRGIGIPEKDLRYIFDRFYRVDKARTRKSGGTGLGLSIVQQIVKKHDGEVKVGSELGKGTVVEVKIPLFEF